MVGKSLLQRSRGDEERSITQITVGRVNCQTGQHCAQQPCDNVAPRCDGTVHVPNDKSLPARSPAAPFKMGLCEILEVSNKSAPSWSALVYFPSFSSSIRF
jgi:hypothetical protein